MFASSKLAFIVLAAVAAGGEFAASSAIKGSMTYVFQSTPRSPTALATTRSCSATPATASLRRRTSRRKYGLLAVQSALPTMDPQLPACHRQRGQDRRCVRQPSSRRGMCLNITCFLPSDMSCLSPSVLVSPARTARSRTLSLLATRAPESLSWRVPRRTSSLPTTPTSTARVRTSTRERYERELDVLACRELH